MSAILDDTKHDKAFLEQVAQTLEKAAGALEKYGWRRGGFGSVNVGFCAVGALRFSQNIPMGVVAIDSSHEIYQEARRQLGQQVGRQVVNWNDRAAKDVTDVTGAMRSTARRVRAEAS